MSEELLQRDFVANPEKVGIWDFYNIGSTPVSKLKEYGIIRSVSYGKAIERKKVDGIIVHNKQVIAIIENKSPDKFRSKEQKSKAVLQELEVAKSLGAKLLIATDTKESIWVNVSTGNKILDENGSVINDVFDKNSDEIVKLIEKINYSISEHSDYLKQKRFVNPTNLAKSIWQDVWSVSGATPENCLYTFVELFIFKYLSDLDVLKGIHNFHTLYDMYEDNTEEEVLQYYADIVRKKIKTLFPENVMDKTTIINGTIFVSKDQRAVKGYSTVFKKVLNKFKEYGKLEHIDHDFKSQLFESFLKESISKKNWGQFFTPLRVVKAIGSMSSEAIREGAVICDPACGVGKFLLEPIASQLNELYKVEKGVVSPKVSIKGFDKGFDKDEQKTIILAKANMLIHFSSIIKEYPNLTNEFSDIFNESFKLETNSILGTLSHPSINEYDLILTNPPYVMSGSSNLKEEIKKVGVLSDHYKINASGVDGLFMEWIVRALKPGGKAFVVIPDGMLTRINDKLLREFIVDECYLDAIISLPKKTFFTTAKKTYILAITKKAKPKIEQEDPVFTYLVSEIGESLDNYRFEIGQDDLTEAAALFNFFKGNRKEFSKFNRDPRCKIQDIELFIKNIEQSWNIDDWWEQKEKIELGVVEEEKVVKFKDVPQLLNDVIDNITNLKNEISEENNIAGVKFRGVILDEILNSPPTNSGLKKKDVFLQKSDENCIPVYSATKDEDAFFGWVNKNTHWKKYNNMLTWNKDGSSGYVFYRDHEFVPYEKVKLLEIKEEHKESLSYRFLKHVIQLRMIEEGYDFNKKCSMEKVLKLDIQIPVDCSNEFDLREQKDLSKKYDKISELTERLNKELKLFNDLKIKI